MVAELHLDGKFINPVMLNFRSRNIEEEYLLWSYDNNIHLVRLFLIIGVLVHLSILPLEKKLLGPGYEQFWSIRILLLIPACIGAYAATYRYWFRENHQVIAATLVLVTGLAMALGTLMYPHVEAVHFVRASITVVMFSIALFGIHFVLAGIVSWIIILANLATVLYVRTNTELLASEVSMLLVFGVTLTFIAYKQEKTERLSYISLLNMQENERKKNDMERVRLSWLENLARFLKHEIRNTIAGAITSHRLLERHIRDDDGRKYLGRAKKSVGLIQELLETVTNATSVESAFYTDKKEKMEISRIIHDQIESYRMIYPDTEIIFKDDDNNIIIDGTEERILQLLDNLVINAMDHNVENKPIHVTLKKTGNSCELSVINEGPPLPENHDLLYKLFYSDKGEKGRRENRGIGLYIVKMIAEGYGGLVRASSPENMTGAEFRVTIPLVS
jgi:signal transduction histidine kinase